MGGFISRDMGGRLLGLFVLFVLIPLIQEQQITYPCYCGDNCITYARCNISEGFGVQTACMNQTTGNMTLLSSCNVTTCYSGWELSLDTTQNLYTCTEDVPTPDVQLIVIGVLFAIFGLVVIIVF